MSTPGPVPTHLIFYIGLEDYQFYLNFDETEMKMKPDHSSENKLK